jgi:hypothetical protein
MAHMATRKLEESANSINAQRRSELGTSWKLVEQVGSSWYKLEARWREPVRIFQNASLASATITTLTTGMLRRSQ